ncbi:MAG: ABC transporter substrate-binding protein [Lentisphaeria bacterium]|nr:ABC transporter substrate-binding protein [Lentisphaeria bacterium]
MTTRVGANARWVPVGIVAIGLLVLCSVARRWLRQGGEVPVPPGPVWSRPARIVSLAPSITEVLFAVGLGDAVAGVTRYCDHPAEARTRPQVGGYFDPNYEAIVALDPDLVILLLEHQAPRQVLAGQGIEVLAVNHGTIEGILDSIRSIGEAGGAGDRADALLRQIRSRVEAVAARTRDLPRVRVLLVVGRDVTVPAIEEVYIAGNAGWYSELIELAGGTNAYRGSVASPKVSAEGILTMDPEVIVEVLGDVTDPSLDGGKAAAGWQALPRVRAVQQGRVHLFRDEFAVIPGPRFVLVLEKLARVLHPEVDWDAARLRARETSAPGMAPAGGGGEGGGS